MRRPSYTLKFDQHNADGAFIMERSIPGLASLDGARRAYRRIRDAYAQMGYRTAHDCIVGPQGEVYATEEAPE